MNQMIWPVRTSKALILGQELDLHILKKLSKSLEYPIFGGILCLVLPEITDLGNTAKLWYATALT